MCAEVQNLSAIPRRGLSNAAFPSPKPIPLRPSYNKNSSLQHFFRGVVSYRLCGNGDLDLDTGLDVDDDLLDNLGGGVEAVHG